LTNFIGSRNKTQKGSPDQEDASGQGFLLFYGAFIGLVAGTLGALWSTLFFEYTIKGDSSLEFYFWLVSTGFIVTIIVMALWMLFFLRRSENDRLHSEKSS
jgi:hypothetical protein